jgi:hypothetical protein
VSGPSGSWSGVGPAGDRGRPGQAHRVRSLAGPARRDSLRLIAQDPDYGPIPLAAAHAADGLQQLLAVIAAGQAEVTWSKVQTAPATIAETQAYALRQLDALAEKMERKTKIGELAEAAKEADVKVREWLAVLARCFQLQDAIAVLELDRVLDASPEELDGHRLGLKAARKDRLDVISRCTEQLMARMDAAAGTANSKVLLHPTTSPAVVQSREHVALTVADFHGRLGIESGRSSLEARRWVDAAAEFRDKALETGADRVDIARRLGNETLDRAKSVTGKLPNRIAQRALRRRGDEERRDEQG